MRMSKKAFTLVEMLFVVIIAALALTFSAYKLRDLKFQGVRKGATGFLMDIANAKNAMKNDLAMQGGVNGMSLDECLRADNSENIEITTAGKGKDLEGSAEKSLKDYLEENGCSEESFIKAMWTYGYIQFGINTTGAYKYYWNIGYPISNTCGALQEGMDEQVVAYMCGNDPRGSTGQNWNTQDDTRCKISDGWAYMNNGTIRERDYDQKPPLDNSKNSSNPCVWAGGTTSGFSCKQKTKSLQGTSTTHVLSCAELSGWQAGYVALDQSTSGECTPGAAHFSCTTTCKVDYTHNNNEGSDEFGHEHSVWVIIDGASTEISCYDYWHNYGQKEGY